MFGLTALTYVEGASLHQERGGSTVFARYAFNELVSFIAGWAILLDYIILIAVTTYSATQYLRVFWHPLGNSTEALLLSLAFIAFVVLANIRGFGGRRARRIGMLVIGDLALQLLIVVLGLVLFFDPHTLLAPIHLGSAPTWSGLIFALTIAAIAFTSLESASGLAGEVRISRARPAPDGRQRHGHGRTRIRGHRGGGGHGAARARRSHRAGEQRIWTTR